MYYFFIFINLLPSYEVTNHGKFSAILFLQISFCILIYLYVLGSNTIINVVSVRNTLNLGDLLRKPVIHSKKIDYPAYFYNVLMVATTALSQNFFYLYPRIPKRLELFRGLRTLLSIPMFVILRILTQVTLLPAFVQ